MKSSMILKPLVFAMATAMMTSAFAQVGAEANVSDTQVNTDNYGYNESTENNASAEGSLDGAAGNVGANVAAGDNNQQANAAAISTADALFVFGTALNAEAAANVTVDQQNNTNSALNFSTLNNATLTDSGNDASGNVGVNVASGNSNQQKNDLAIASNATAYLATATATVNQQSNGNITENNGTAINGTQQVSLTLSGTGTYEGISDQFGDLYPDTWSGPSHTGGDPTGHIDLDSDAQGAQDRNDDGGALSFNEAGTLTLAGTVTGNVPAVIGFTPVLNNATVSGSLNNVAGNVGLNVAAGSGNQQSNSLALAAGCNACVTPTPTPPPGGGGVGE